jgi:hypothetical protein
MSALVLVPVGQAQTLAPPSPPQNVEVVAADGGTQVTWEAPLFNGGSDSITYRVYRDSALVADGLDAMSFLDTSITASATATSYTVTAVNEVGESAHSGGQCIGDNIPPIAPGNCVALAIALAIWVVGQVPPSV